MTKNKTSLLSILIVVFVLPSFLSGQILGVSMTCQRVDHVQLEAERARLGQKQLYSPGAKGRANVQFHFQLDPNTSKNSLFVIYSSRMRTPVYRGPYRDSLKIDFDEKLSADRFFDNVRFSLLNDDTGQLCTWNNERGEQYWRPSAHVYVQFLDEMTLDEDNLPKRFNVLLR
jgi:hypothetical protein